MKFIHNCFIKTRSSNGQLLVVSSSDGFCSIISFSKDELGIPYTNNTKVVIEAAESIVNEDIEEDISSIKNTPPKSVEQDEKQSVEFSEPPTKKRVQLVTLSSPKTKKYLNK